MLKRIICIILSVIMAVSCFSLCFGVMAADSTMDTLVSLVKRFPAGKYWNHMGSSINNPDGWTETPCASHSNCGYYPGDCSCNSFDNAIQCMGYAYKIAYEITGVSARNFTCYYTLNVANLRVGDVIRYNGHSICVTGVSGTKISFTDANYISGCGIRWGQMDISSIRNFSYVEHLESNTRTNTDLDFYEDVDTSGSTPSTPSTPSAPVKGETWKMSAEDSLNIRSSASASASIVGSVPANAQFTVTEKKAGSDYLWGKVYYNGVTGWAALNYSTYISGSYKLPQINNEKSSYSSLKVSLSWDAVDGADSYKIAFFDSESNVIGQYSTSATSYTMTFSSAGSYQARVYASNSMASSWTLKSDIVNFKVTNGSSTPSTPVKGEIWKMSAEDSLNIRSSASASASIVGSVPASAQFTVTEKKTSTDYLWGKVTYGGVTGWAVLNYSTYVSGSYKLPQINNEKSSYTSLKVSLSWDAVDGADKYKIAFFDSSNKVVSQYSTTATSYTMNFSSAGSYQARVYASNSKTSSWILKSDIVKFKVTNSSTTPSTPASGETWQMNDEGSLNVRSSASTSAAVVGYVPASAKFTVSEKKTSADYLWGKVTYGNVTGWAVLNYSTYISGIKQTPEINNEKSSYSSLKVSLSWNAVNGADKYKIAFFDTSNKVVAQYYTTSTSYTMNFSANGTYQARVYAINSFASSWIPKSSVVKFTVKGTAKPANVTGLKQNLSATTTTSLSFSWKALSGVDGYDVFRYNASAKKYESMGSVKTNSFTDKTVKTGTNYYYLVRGYVYNGSTRVAGNNVKILCSTDPAQVTGISQSGSSSTSVTLKWNKVANATLYVVYKYNASTKTYSRISTTASNSVTISQGANTNVYYRVYAATKTAAGYNYGKASVAFKARSGPAKTTVTLTNAGTGRVKIAWKPVSGATHYQIFRYESGAYKKIATVSADYSYFTNINLTSGRNYYYLVRPINYSASAIYYGSYSAKAVIKTA